MAGLALATVPDGSGQLDELVLSRAGLGGNQRVSGGELGEVAGSGRPPVLLRPQSAAIGQSLDTGGQRSDQIRVNLPRRRHRTELSGKLSF